MSEADNFKNRYLQQPITFLTEENLDKLENHCKKAIHYERGVEHQVVLELLERYKEFLAEREEDKKRKKIEKPILSNGTIVYCRGTAGTSSFYGIVYPKGILELENGSDAYINTNGDLHLGDQISYWIIERVVKAKLIIEDIIEEDK